MKAIQNRKEEIVNKFESFKSDETNREELISEMIKLQSEISSIVTDGDTSKLRIWDSVKLLEDKNNKCGHIADAELQKFIADCKNFSNLIRANISGSKGENMTAQSINNIQGYCKILRNIELESNGKRTELDFVVITGKAIFILEVKNTKRDIFNDKNGNYFRTGEYMNLEYNIKDKMLIRERVLTEALNKAGIYNVNVQSILVFTNNKIKVSNKCDDITVTFLNQLLYIINSYNGWKLYSEDRIDLIETSINDIKTYNSYKNDMDYNELKSDLAELIIALESEPMARKISILDVIKQFFSSKSFQRTAA